MSSKFIITLLLSGLCLFSSYFANAQTNVNAEVKRIEIINTILNGRDEIKACVGDGYEENASQELSQIYKLPNNNYLVQLVCFMAAYQPVQEFYLYEEKPNGKKAIVASLDLQGLHKNKKGQLIKTKYRAIAGLINYKDETKTLSIWTKDRGLGDCGTFSTYKLENEKLVLQELKQKNNCDEEYTEPENYLSIFSKFQE
ncbi:MAG TPA: DUF1176 domain-containing protein [Vampirovibrionales bacterium]